MDTTVYHIADFNHVACISCSVVYPPAYPAHLPCAICGTANLIECNDAGLLIVWPFTEAEIQASRKPSE